MVEDYQGGSGMASGVVEQVRRRQRPRALRAAAALAARRVEFFAGSARMLGAGRVAAHAERRGRRAHWRATRSRWCSKAAARRPTCSASSTVDGRQYVDFETLQEHFGDATRSDLVIHNALRDRSSANFTGLIRINKSAHQTESSQEQKNILLSDHAKADSDPKLEILNNDVDPLHARRGGRAGRPGDGLLSRRVAVWTDRPPSS